LKIAVLHESGPETRVAAIPETVKKFAALGATVAVEKGAGEAASIADAEFEAAGATIASRADALKDADAILCVAGPDAESLKGAKQGALLVGALDPARRSDDVSAYAAAGLEALAMEWMPRITRAQSMDILSSQSNLAGYKAVVDAASAYGRGFPMMMTAAGTVSPAKAFVMGVGVAGLQAIATARRLGAQVSATDVRSATREQILSLGAKPIFVESVTGIEGEGQGGYAGETSPEYQAAQAELVSGHIAKQDIVITTALIPGRKAPILVTEEMIKTMKPGSVIVDLAASAGGNTPLSKPDQVVEAHGVTIMGPSNLPGALAADSSALYARNLFNFVSLIVDKKSGALNVDWNDEIVKGSAVTKEGAVVPRG
jgi:H+-translocating NAD(P) transhydrogenase subunit alpha